MKGYLSTRRGIRDQTKRERAIWGHTRKNAIFIDKKGGRKEKNMTARNKKEKIFLRMYCIPIQIGETWECDPLFSAQKVECNPHGGSTVVDKLYQLSHYYLKNFNKEYKLFLIG